MSQLTDDCFAFGGKLIPVADALARFREILVPVVEPEAVPLATALGRVLAADVIADRSVPPHDNSAVDGFAALGRAGHSAPETCKRVEDTPPL